MRINAKDTVAIVVDYQERLITMPVMYEKEELLKNTAILLNGLKRTGYTDCRYPAVHKRTWTYCKGNRRSVGRIQKCRRENCV